MANIVPDGYPLWARVPTIAQYGGSATKRDYGGIGAVNAETDVKASQLARMTADQVAVARVTPLLVMRFTPTNTMITVNYCAPTWAAAVENYSGNPATGPSAAYPVVSHSSSDLTVQMPSSVSDEYGIAQAVAPKIAMVTTGASMSGDISSNTITLTSWSENVPILLEVW